MYFYVFIIYNLPLFHYFYLLLLAIPKRYLSIIYLSYTSPLALFIAPLYD